MGIELKQGATWSGRLASKTVVIDGQFDYRITNELIKLMSPVDEIKVEFSDGGYYEFRPDKIGDTIFGVIAHAFMHALNLWTNYDTSNWTPFQKLELLRISQNESIIFSKEVTKIIITSHEETTKN